MAIIEPSCINLCNMLEHVRSNNYIKMFNINMIFFSFIGPIK